MSALEHAVPEKFFNDPAQCNSYDNPTPVAGLPNCPQGISAVKALGLAAAQGQRIYTITPEVYAANPNIVNTALSAHSVDTKRRVQRALDSGMEVTIHQAPIVESGWRGAGFIGVDQITGAGGYTIEGGASGGGLEVEFAQRYIDWVCAHMITNNLVLGTVGLLSPFLPVTKALFGFKPLLGDSNPYTKIIRGIALVLLGSGILTKFAAFTGPFLAPIAVTLLIFVGFFNISVLIEGLFYARFRKWNSHVDFAAIDNNSHLCWCFFKEEKIHNKILENS